MYYIENMYSTTHIYHALLNTNFTNTDVAVPGLNRDFAHSRKLLIPDVATLALFEERTRVIRTQVSQLERQSGVLAQARDLLLPRLMNGEVGV